MGGTLGAVMAAQPGNPIRRLVVNDVGPLLPKPAADRIMSYVGLDPSFPSLEAMEVSLRQIYATFGPAGFARMVERAGADAKFGFKTHPHMLRHACGYALANRGHDTRALQAYLGHKNIQHTVRYTELSPKRFKNFWRE